MLARDDAYDILDLPDGRTNDFLKLLRSLCRIAHWKDADQDTIRTSYKRLALKWYPEKHNNSPAAFEKFREIGNAYAILTLEDDEYDSDEEEVSFSMEECMELFHRSLSGHNIPQLNQRYGYSDNYDHSGSSSDEDDWSSRVGRRKFRPDNSTYNTLTVEEIQKNANELIEQEQREKEQFQQRNGRQKRKKDRKKNNKSAQVEKNNNIKSEGGKKKSAKKIESVTAEQEEDAIDTNSAFFTRIANKNPSLHHSSKKEAKPKISPELSQEDLSSKVLRARELAKNGNEKAKSGDYVDAIELFKMAISLDPKDHRFYSNRSFCYDQTSNHNQALSDANKAIELNSQWPKGYFRKGRALMGLKKYSEAEDAFLTVLKYDTQSSEAKQQLIETRELKLMEFGFNKIQVESALRQYKTVQQALDALLAGKVQEIEIDDEEIYISDNDLDKQLAPEVLHSDVENPNGLTALWVGNVLPIVTDKILQQLFSRCGTVTSVRCLPEKFCAFINFTDKYGAGRAIKNLQGVECGGQNLLIKFPDNPVVGNGVGPRTTVLTKGAQNGPSGAFAGKTRHVTVPEGECYFWRTIGCSYGDRCRNLHKPECKGVDRKPRHH